jgi:hypothetical protein
VKESEVTMDNIKNVEKECELLTFHENSEVAGVAVWLLVLVKQLKHEANKNDI